LNHRILIVDDERDTLTAFSRLLRRLVDCTVDVTDTLPGATQAIDDGDYDVIVTDLRLTVATGEEGLDLLRRAKQKTSAAAVIIVTGYGCPAVMTKAYELGAAYYFEKPVQPARLIQAVEELCR